MIIFMLRLFIGQGRIQVDAIDANASVRKKLPIHSSVRFLPQIMKNNTFCENTRLKDAQISTKLPFPRIEYDAFSQIYI